MNTCRCGNAIDLLENWCDECKTEIRARHEEARQHLQDAGSIHFEPENEVERRIHEQRRKGKQWGRASH